MGVQVPVVHPFTRDVTCHPHGEPSRNRCGSAAPLSTDLPSPGRLIRHREARWDPMRRSFTSPTGNVDGNHLAGRR